jgi:hypothetical protein
VPGVLLEILGGDVHGVAIAGPYQAQSPAEPRSSAKALCSPNEMR